MRTRPKSSTGLRLDYLSSRWHGLHPASCHTILIPLMVTLLVMCPNHCSHQWCPSQIPHASPAFSSPASQSVSSSQTGLGIHIHIPTPQFLWMLIIGHPHPKFIDFHQLSVGTSLANLVPFQAPCWDPVLGKQLLVDWLNLMDRITCSECKSKQLHPTGNGLSVSLAEEDVLRYNPEYNLVIFLSSPCAIHTDVPLNLLKTAQHQNHQGELHTTTSWRSGAVKNLRSRRTMSDHGPM